jgi:hypothetical protein
LGCDNGTVAAAPTDGALAMSSTAKAVNFGRARGVLVTAEYCLADVTVCRARHTTDTVCSDQPEIASQHPLGVTFAGYGDPTP